MCARVVLHLSGAGDGGEILRLDRFMLWRMPGWEGAFAGNADVNF